MTYEKNRYFCEDVNDFARGLTFLILGIVGHAFFEEGQVEGKGKLRKV